MAGGNHALARSNRVKSLSLKNGLPEDRACGHQKGQDRYNRNAA
jgi:hypothetical protein